MRAKKEESPKAHMLLHHGISDKDVDFSIKIDAQYDIKKANVVFKDGLLRIIVPKAKDAESVMLFWLDIKLFVLWGGPRKKTKPSRLKPTGFFNVFGLL